MCVYVYLNIDMRHRYLHFHTLDGGGRGELEDILGSDTAGDHVVGEDGGQLLLVRQEGGKGGLVCFLREYVCVCNVSGCVGEREEGGRE
jgi:hypothetical protein